jgi:SAM-dependent methyltransferase
MRRLAAAVRDRWRSRRALHPFGSPAAGGAAADAVAHPGVFGRIHRADLMVGGTTAEQLAVYKRIGTTATALVEQALGLVGRRLANADAVLDFGCGYGRVTRVLVQKLPPARISAFDVDPGAARFCAQEFGVRALTFTRGWEWESVGFARYDVIWVGSVFTHLAEGYTRETLSLLFELLQPGGVLVFTTHGDEALRRVRSGFFGPTVQPRGDAIEQGLAARGFHFFPYTADELGGLPFEFQRADEFGMTWMTEAYMTELLRSVSGGALHVLRFEPQGWEHLQDAFMCQRT